MNLHWIAVLILSECRALQLIPKSLQTRLKQVFLSNESVGSNNTHYHDHINICSCYKQTAYSASLRLAVSSCVDCIIEMHVFILMHYLLHRAIFAVLAVAILCVAILYVAMFSIAIACCCMCAGIAIATSDTIGM